MKHVSYIVIFLILLSGACKKHVDEQTQTIPTGPGKIKIEVLSGNNQSDTIGQTLKDTIVIKVTRADTLLKNYQIQFTDSSCGLSTTSQLNTSNLGLAKYSWKLNATPGLQKLKISLYDSVLNIKDSISIASEGILPDSAWLPGSCLPSAHANDFAELNSGRIICGLNMFSGLFYSDDNGQSWQKLNSFPYTYVISKICIGPNDEIYIATSDNGIYFSADKGQTWQPRSNGITDVRYFTDFAILRSGKLMVSTYFGGLFLSSDKGINWTRVSATLNFNDRFYSFCESASGELYTVTDVDELWKSTNDGLTWSRVRYSGFSSIQSLFIDDNGDMFVGSNGYEGYLYKSIDNGSIWTKVYTTPVLPGVYDEIIKITRKNNYYYFIVAGYGLVRTKDFLNYNKIFNTTKEYLATNSGSVLVSDYARVFYNNHP